MIYFLVFLFLFGIYYSYKYAWWTRTVNVDYPRILMYHMVSEHKKNAKFNGLRVKIDEFEKQIKFLVENDWHFFTMSELVENKDRLPSRSVAVTFDDGYEDNFTNAFPILKKYNVRATIYLVVDRHNREWSSKRKAKNNTNELKNEPKLSDFQIKELLSSGLIEIGSHTMTHDNLPRLTSAEKMYEIIESKKQIEDFFDITCNSFAYPFGLYDSCDIEIVKKSGYSNATTTEKGIECITPKNVHVLKRVTISGKDNFFTFKIKMKRGLRGVKK